eukprot:COSAG05_NODE_76_length_21413_cov_40.065122_5_plen_136_part_00
MLVRACRYFSNHPLVSNANASQPHGRGWFNVSEGGAAQEQKMLGAEGCMWGEHTNGDVLNLRMWPRATACVGHTLLSSLLCACPVEEGFSCSSGPVCVSLDLQDGRGAVEWWRWECDRGVPKTVAAALQNEAARD